MEDNLFELMQQKKQEEEAALILSCNEKTKKFGLTLTPEDAKELVTSRNESLRASQRIEFGSSILEKLIYAFCDSQYIEQDDYAEVLTELLDIFYQYKNEAQDKLTDDELITFMKEQFEGICTGDTDYLADTCLDRFSKAIRGGYTGYKNTGASGEYSQFDEEVRWDRNLYLQILSDLLQ